MNDLNRHKRSDKIKWIWTLIAFFLIAVILVGVCLQVFGKGKVKPSNWGKDDEQKTEQGGGMELPEETEANGLKIISVEIPRSRFAAMGVSPAAESAYTVTATVTGTGLTADQKKVSWTAAWAEDFEPFLDGAESVKEEDVQTYVKTTVQEDVNQIQVECLKPFSWQVELTATSTFNTSKSASLKVDYKEKIEVTGIKFSDNNGYSASVTIYGESVWDDCILYLDYLVSKTRTLSVLPTVERSEKYTVDSAEFDIVLTPKAPSVILGVKSYPALTLNTGDKVAKTLSGYYDSSFHTLLAKKSEAEVTSIYNELKNQDYRDYVGFHVEIDKQNVDGDISVVFDTSELETWYTAFSSVEVTTDHSGGILF